MTPATAARTTTRTRTTTTKACAHCGNTEEIFDPDRPIKLNRDGICRICVESIAEAEADDDATLERADEIRRRRALGKGRPGPTTAPARRRLKAR